MRSKEKPAQGKFWFTRYLGYGVGAIGMDLSYGLFNAFLMNYLTDVLYISAAFMGVVAALARIWDGINDPMMGTIVDNTRSKAGKFRPWILTGAILNAVVLVFLFTNPGFSVGTGSVGLYAYAAIMYVLWGMSYTIMDIPYWSMVPALTSDPEKRNIIATIPRFFSGFGQIIIVVLTLPMVKLLGAGNTAAGYQRWVAIAAVILVIGSLIAFLTTKGKTMPLPESKEKFTLKRAFQTVKNNDQLLVFMLTAIAFNTGWYLTNGLGVYYFKSVLNKPGLLSAFGVIGGAGQALGLILLPLLSKKFGRRRVIIWAMGMSFIGYLGMFLFGPILNVFAVFAVFGVFGCMGIGCMFVAETILLADIVDYGEFKLGYRTDSIVFSMKSLLLKVAYSVQSLIIGVGLSLSHYDGKLVELGSAQPASAQNTISIMMFLIPPLFVALSYLIFSKKYKLHGAFMDEVSQAVNEKHEKELAQEQAR